MARYEDRGPGLKVVAGTHIPPAGSTFNRTAAHQQLLDVLPIAVTRQRVEARQDAVKAEFTGIRQQMKFLSAAPWERAKLWRDANPRAEDWMLAALHERAARAGSWSEAFDSFESDLGVFLQRAHANGAQLDAGRLARQIRHVYETNPQLRSKPPGYKRWYNHLPGLKNAMPKAERAALAKAAVLKPAGAISIDLRRYQNEMLKDIGFVTSYAAGGDPARKNIIPQRYSELSRERNRLKLAHRRLTGRDAEKKYAQRTWQRFFYADDIALFGGRKSFARSKLNGPQRAALITLLKETERAAGPQNREEAARHVMDAIKFSALEQNGRTTDIIATLDHLARSIRYARESRSRFYPLTGRTAWREKMAELCDSTRTHLNYHALSAQHATLLRALNDPNQMMEALNWDASHIGTKGRNDYRNFKLASTVWEPVKRGLGGAARSVTLALAFVAASGPVGEAVQGMQDAQREQRDARYADIYLRMMDYRMKMELRIVEGLQDYNNTNIETGRGPVPGLESSYVLPRPLAAIIFRHLPSLQPAGYNEAAYVVPTIERETSLTPERIAKALTDLPITQQDDVRFALAADLRASAGGRFLGDQLFRAPSAIDNFAGQEARTTEPRAEQRRPQRGIALGDPSVLDPEETEPQYRVRPNGEPVTRP